MGGQACRMESEGGGTNDTRGCKTTALTCSMHSEADDDISSDTPENTPAALEAEEAIGWMGGCIDKSAISPL